MNLPVSKLQNLKKILDLNIWGNLASILSFIGLGWLVWWLEMTWEFLWIDTPIQFVYFIAIIILFVTLIVFRCRNSVKQCKEHVKQYLEEIEEPVKQCIEEHVRKYEQCIEKFKKLQKKHVFQTEKYNQCSKECNQYFQQLQKLQTEQYLTEEYLSEEDKILIRCVNDNKQLIHPELVFRLISKLELSHKNSEQKKSAVIEFIDKLPISSSVSLFVFIDSTEEDKQLTNEISEFLIKNKISCVNSIPNLPEKKEIESLLMKFCSHVILLDDKIKSAATFNSRLNRYMKAKVKLSLRMRIMVCSSKPKPTGQKLSENNWIDCNTYQENIIKELKNE